MYWPEGGNRRTRQQRAAAVQGLQLFQSIGVLAHEVSAPSQGLRTALSGLRAKISAHYVGPDKRSAIRRQITPSSSPNRQYQNRAGAKALSISPWFPRRTTRFAADRVLHRYALLLARQRQKICRLRRGGRAITSFRAFTWRVHRVFRLAPESRALNTGQQFIDQLLLALCHFTVAESDGEAHRAVDNFDFTQAVSFKRRAGRDKSRIASASRARVYDFDRTI